MKYGMIFFIIFLGILVIYGLGPKPQRPILNTKLPSKTSDLVKLEQEVIAAENQTPHLKPNNQAEIVWYNPQKKTKTKYCLVYLHGFSASRFEGYPVHRDFAHRYGCNLYLNRLAGHGTDEPEAFLNLTPEQLLQSAKEAIAIAQQLGEEVIIMASSTGFYMLL
jgi:pimeloyl-ACP methyl ester carboxylesterase